MVEAWAYEIRWVQFPAWASIVVKILEGFATLNTIKKNELAVSES